jgi:hypothetical protein
MAVLMVVESFLRGDWVEEDEAAAAGDVEVSVTRVLEDTWAGAGGVPEAWAGVKAESRVWVFAGTGFVADACYLIKPMIFEGSDGVVSA